MSIKKKYYIEAVDYKTAMDVVVKNHYLHRKSPCSFAFGLFERDTNELKGVVVYGKPASNSLCKGICGEEEKHQVIELNRLWISDEVGRNAESFLIGNTIKQLPFEIIVSYADTSEDHIGYVYQATNFIYTGLSDKHILWVVEGYSNRHSRHLFNEYGGINKAKEILGDKMVKKERPRKHRYIYFNATKKRKKELLEKLRYPTKEYPKKVVNECQ